MSLIATMALLHSGQSVAAQDGKKQVEVSYTMFDAEVTVGDTKLPLHGGDLLEYWGFDVYTGVLYVDAEAVKEGRELNADTTRSLVLHYHRTLGADDFQEATRKGFEANPNYSASDNRRAFRQLQSVYQEMGKNDRYRIDYSPASGLTIYQNGNEVFQTDDAEFARAYHGIWFGPHALNKSLRRALLNLE
jgi:hypothetical protein